MTGLSFKRARERTDMAGRGSLAGRLRLPQNRHGALLLGAALTLCAGAAAAAEPPPVADARVRQCAAQGKGFAYIPGTDTCLRVGGFMEYEAYYNSYNQEPAQNDRTYTIATASLVMDARTATEYGTLRSYTDLRFRWRTANEFSDGPSTSQISPYYMYIQLAGFTIGHQQSFFDFYANANVYGTDTGTVGDQTRLNMLAYTFEMDHGFSATVSLEDSVARMSGIYASNPALAGSVLDYQTPDPLPEIVAVFGQTGDWGQFQLSGALHQVAGSWSGLEDTQTWGYALQAGVMFNLPFIAANDTLYLQAAYANGATSYLGIQDWTGDFAPPDAFLTPTGGLSLVSGWSAVAQLLHNWTPAWSTVLFGGYAEFAFNDALAQTVYGSTGGTNYNIGGNINWIPGSYLQLTLQYDYNVYQASDYVQTAYGLPTQSQRAHQLVLIAQRFF
ncbi:porin [Aquabacter cavernae]|uniref:porin n=1 Tax=Aquabacter cavernae TaxID=2496029 RepID=UPI001FDF0F46|nr:porin [Aquabacter cavernae]